MQLGESLHLHGPKHEHNTVGAEVVYHATFIAAGGFNADTGDTGFTLSAHEAFEASA